MKYRQYDTEIEDSEWVQVFLGPSARMHSHSFNYADF